MKPRLSGQVQVHHDASDRRLRRLAETRRDPQAPSERHREEPEVVIGDEEGEIADIDERDYGVEREEPGTRRMESDDEDDDDAMEARRERLRMLARQRRALEVVEQAAPMEEDGDEDEGSSEWEYETDSDQDDARQLVKPVFVPKQSRATIEERDRIEAEYEEQEKAKAKREEERRRETRELVAAELRRQQQAAAAAMERKTREDTESEGNEDEEYDKWRIRELKRIKRAREEREQHDKERKDVERRRLMTDQQVMAEDKVLGKGKKTRGQMTFMQKYHHKGAFFMENNESNQFKEQLYNRNFNEALQEDRAVAKLAAGPYSGSTVLQLRRGQFGRMGQTKWTHLTNEDTTKFDSPWAQDDSIRRKFQAKGGGMGKSAVKKA